MKSDESHLSLLPEHQETGNILKYFSGKVFHFTLSFTDYHLCIFSWIHLRGMCSHPAIYGFAIVLL